MHCKILYLSLLTILLIVNCNIIKSYGATPPIEFYQENDKYSNGMNGCTVELRLMFVGDSSITSRTITSNMTTSSVSFTTFSPTKQLAVVTFNFGIGTTTYDLSICELPANNCTTFTNYPNYNCIAVPLPNPILLGSKTFMYDPFTLDTGVMPIKMVHSYPPPPYTCKVNGTAYQSCEIKPISSSDPGYSYFYIRIRFAMSSSKYNANLYVTISDMLGRNTSFIATPFINNGPSTVSSITEYPDTFLIDCTQDYYQDTSCRFSSIFTVTTVGSFIQYLPDNMPTTFRPTSRPILGNLQSAKYIATINGPAPVSGAGRELGTTYSEFGGFTWSVTTIGSSSFSTPSTSFNQTFNVPFWTFKAGIRATMETLESNQTVNGIVTYQSYKYPYGIGSGTLSTYVGLTYSRLISKYQSPSVTLNLQYFESIGQFVLNPPTPTIIDSTGPQLISIIYTPIDSYSLIVRVEASDDISGVYRILIGDIKSNYIQVNQFDLVYGTKFNGVFETVFNFTDLSLYSGSTVTLLDEAGNKGIYSKSSILINNTYPLPDIPMNYMSYYPSDLTYFEFHENNIDTTNTIAMSELRFNITNIDKKFKPKMEIFSDYFDREWIENYNFQGSYREDVDMYVIPLQLPMNVFTRSVDYKIFMRPFVWTQRNIVASFGVSAYLNVTSSSADEIGPFFDNFARSTSSLTVSGTTVPTIYWTFNIIENANSFGYGEVTITSDIDTKPYHIYFDQSNITGSKFQINFSTISKCRTQKYSFVNATLYDTMGHRTIMLANSFPSSEMMNDQQAFRQVDSISVSCGTTAETVVPKLLSFDFYPKDINVGAINETDRTVIFNFTVMDAGSGISTRHIPTVYLTSLQEELISYEAKSLSYNLSTASYSVVAVIPYGFGVAGSLVSLYGISDNHMNTLGLSANDLGSANLPNFINTTFSLPQPWLLYASNITSQGGDLTVYGKSFGKTNDSLVALIYYYDQRGFVNIETKFFSGTILMFNVSEPIPDGAVIKVVVNGIESNELKINGNGSHTPPPTQTPTVKPISCPGTPQCNGKGDCINGVCSCYTGYGGSECNEIVDPNPGTPTNNNQSDPTFIFGKGVIGVTRLLEIGTSGEIVKQYKLDNWTFVNTTYDPSMNRTTPNRVGVSESYQFTCILEERTTLVTVSVEYFNQQTNFTFAGDQINMSPNTLKYSIYISQYMFQSKLNILQLVMTAALYGEKSTACGSQQYGTDSSGSLTWLKLKVNEKILYTRFIRKGLIDGHPTLITSKVISASDSGTGSTLTDIGLNIPNYHISTLIDPDFTLLIDPTAEKGADCSSKSDPYRKATVIIVSVVTVVVGSLIIAGSIYIFRRKRNLKRELEMNERRASGILNEAMGSNRGRISTTL